MGRTFSKCVYFAVKICRRKTFSNANVVFPVLENFIPIVKKKTNKNKQRYLGTWVGQVDSGKIKLNKGDNRGNCQRLSMKLGRLETRTYGQFAGII